ncbi:unnamed protein product, partial [Rotaria sordida]
MSIFNEDYIEDAAKACQYLSILRPELIVPPIMKKLFLSIDNITEPGRFTLIMKCLPGIICQIVRQTSNYSEGQTYVLTLMMSILPCIDSNDFEKIAVTLEVLDAILKLVPCIDCSSAIHTRNDLTEIIHQKIIKFLTGSLFSSKVRKFVAGLVRVIIKVNPIEILKYLLPQTCEHIENIMNNSQTAILMDHKGDIELTWHLVLFSELVRARGDTLLIYKQMIMSVFHQCIRIVHKDSYEAIAKAAKHLLKSLSDLYSIDDQLSLENMDESFVDCLPIRAWGQHVDFDQLQVQYHFPTVDEIDFACEFVNTFIYAELQLLNEKCLNLSKEERLRSLTLIHYIAVGCLRMVSRIESNQVIDLVPTVVPYGSKYRFRYSIYSKEPKFRDNLRMRLLIDIGNLLDILVENHCDDVASINTAINIYALLPIYYGISQYDINKLCQYIGLNEALFKYKLGGKRQNPRFLTIKQITIQIKKFELYHFETFTEIDKQIVLKLFKLSINRYSDIRSNAQINLFTIVNDYFFSYQVIVDHIYAMLNRSDKVDHDQIKGCLYILLGDNYFFLPTQPSWTMMEKLWPSIIVCINHTNKLSIKTLIDEISTRISEEFHMHALIEDINEMSMRAATNLWDQLKPNEMETCKERNQNNIQSYNNLMETLNLLLNDDKLTWGQHQISMSLMCLLLQKRVPIPLSCIRTLVDFIVHDNIELRKYAVIGMTALCRLQKPPRVYVEKSLDEILRH